MTTRLLPLILGLGIVAFGVCLAVSTRSRSYIWTVAFWYLVGSAWMLILTGVTAFEAADPLAELHRSGVVATAVAGGGIGPHVPNLGLASLARHLTWGGTLGLVYALLPY